MIVSKKITKAFLIFSIEREQHRLQYDESKNRMVNLLRLKTFPFPVGVYSRRSRFKQV